MQGQGDDAVQGHNSRVEGDDAVQGTQGVQVDATDAVDFGVQGTKGVHGHNSAVGCSSLLVESGSQLMPHMY